MKKKVIQDKYEYVIQNIFNIEKNNYDFILIRLLHNNT